MDSLDNEQPPAPGSVTQLEDSPEPTQWKLPSKPKTASLAQKLLERNQIARKTPSSKEPSAHESPEPSEHEQVQSESAEEQADAPRRRVGRAPTQRLPRNKSLYGMRDLQRSNRCIFKTQTMHKIVKEYTRNVLGRHDIKFGKLAMQKIMRVLEQLIYEDLLRAQALSLTAGRKTLMLHHVETAEHHSRKPNISNWTQQDFEQETRRLEPSRFPNSRLSQMQE